jgi:hypothetical protein
MSFGIDGDCHYLTLTIVTAFDGLLACKRSYRDDQTRRLTFPSGLLAALALLLPGNYTILGIVSRVS